MFENSIIKKTGHRPGKLPSDIPYIIDWEPDITTKLGEVIIFPSADVPVGEEVCIVGEYIN